MHVPCKEDLFDCGVKNSEEFCISSQSSQEKELVQLD